MTSPFALFLPREIALAIAGAAAAQAAFIAIFLIPPPEPLLADVSDDNARPIAVAITPVPLLKLGSKTPAKLPAGWERPVPVRPRAAETPQAAEPVKDRLAQPSTAADAAAAPHEALEAGVATAEDAGLTALPASASPGASGSGAPASTTLGSPDGVPGGTETDPLKARAADAYRGQLAAWFASRFAIRGKVPFDTLKTLSATAIVTTSKERRVTGFSITRPSGDAAFDGAVQATLSSIQSGGVELPAPPPLYPEMLGQTLPVSFRCTNRSQCE